MKYLFGPVNSRRLGLSQGIDLLTTKTCTFDCVYCEIGATKIHTCERKEYTPTADIIAEIDELLANDKDDKPIDVFTITATGEPTLHVGLRRIIEHIKANTGKPVVVLTNGAMFDRADVRSDLMGADIVIPSLDAARNDSFRKIDRPAECVNLQKIIHGLGIFCKEFSGQVWLEVLLVKNLNDSAEDITALKEALTTIKPSKTQLNTVARPPLESFAKPLTKEELTNIARQLPYDVEIIASFAPKDNNNTRIADPKEILEMLIRRPCTVADISKALNLNIQATEQLIEKLLTRGDVLAMSHQGKIYYQPPQPS